MKAGVCRRVIGNLVVIKSSSSELVVSSLLNQSVPRQASAYTANTDAIIEKKKFFLYIFPYVKQ